jgi:hypothetical protein
MRKNFLPFASGARNSVYLQRSSKSLPTTAALDAKESDFIADVYEVLRASHYSLLTNEACRAALAAHCSLPTAHCSLHTAHCVMRAGRNAPAAASKRSKCE